MTPPLVVARAAAAVVGPAAQLQVEEAEAVVDATIGAAEQSAEPVVAGLVALVGVYLVGRLLVTPAIVRVVRRRNSRNPTLVEAVDRYTRLVLFIVAASVGLAVAGYGDVFGGSALVVAALTLALGVAGREVIGNLVSGLFLVSDPDFNVGDWIEWADGAGTVETIRFRVTRVRTAGNQIITVPNTTLATTAVTRPFGGTRIRVLVQVTVDYDADLTAVRTALREEALALEEVLESPEPLVTVEDLTGDGVLVQSVFWLPRSTRSVLARRRSSYVASIKKRLEAEGVTVSPPAGRELSGSIAVDRGVGPPDGGASPDDGGGRHGAGGGGD